VSSLDDCTLIKANSDARFVRVTTLEWQVITLFRKDEVTVSLNTTLDESEEQSNEEIF
jgi:hypothetical protein